MTWVSASEFFAMGGYGLYVWGSYGVAALCMLAQVAIGLTLAVSTYEHWAHRDLLLVAAAGLGDAVGEHRQQVAFGD